MKILYIVGVFFQEIPVKRLNKQDRSFFSRLGTIDDISIAYPFSGSLFTDMHGVNTGLMADELGLSSLSSLKGSQTNGIERFTFVKRYTSHNTIVRYDFRRRKGMKIWRGRWLLTNSSGERQSGRAFCHVLTHKIKKLSI